MTLAFAMHPYFARRGAEIQRIDDAIRFRRSFTDVFIRVDARHFAPQLSQV